MPRRDASDRNRRPARGRAPRRLRRGDQRPGERSGRAPRRRALPRALLRLPHVHEGERVRVEADRPAPGRRAHQRPELRRAPRGEAGRPLRHPERRLLRRDHAGERRDRPAGATRSPSSSTSTPARATSLARGVAMLDLELRPASSPTRWPRALERRGARAELDRASRLDRAPPRRCSTAFRPGAARAQDQDRQGDRRAQRSGRGHVGAIAEATATAAREELGSLSPSSRRSRTRRGTCCSSCRTSPTRASRPAARRTTRWSASGASSPTSRRGWATTWTSRRGSASWTSSAASSWAAGLLAVSRRSAPGCEWALLDLFVSEHLADGYEFMLPPHLLLEEAASAPASSRSSTTTCSTSQTAEDERPPSSCRTSETAILSVFAGEMLSGDELPMKAFAYTPCYRREAGGYRTRSAARSAATSSTRSRCSRSSGRSRPSRRSRSCWGRRSESCGAGPPVPGR